MDYSKKRYFYDKKNDKLIEVAPSHFSETKQKKWFATTEATIYYKENPIDPNTHQLTKIRTQQIYKRDYSSKQDAENNFNQYIRINIQTSNEIDKETFDSMEPDYQ